LNAARNRRPQALGGKVPIDAVGKSCMKQVFSVQDPTVVGVSIARINFAEVSQNAKLTHMASMEGGYEVGSMDGRGRLGGDRSFGQFRLSPIDRG
jgi:hypothetical protein